MDTLIKFLLTLNVGTLIFGIILMSSVLIYIAFIANKKFIAPYMIQILSSEDSKEDLITVMGKKKGKGKFND